nr:MAG TPA: hypothetical protein [Caudoviricetes sp.]
MEQHLRLVLLSVTTILYGVGASVPKRETPHVGEDIV